MKYVEKNWTLRISNAAVCRFVSPYQCQSHLYSNAA